MGLYADIIPAPLAPAPEARRVDGAAAARLQQFAGAQTLAAGQINLLSLDAISQRLGDRWAGKREQVYDYTAQTLDRQIGERGFYLRVSETDILVVLPGEARLAAQVRCLRVMRGVLTHFLGEARPGDLTVREVTRILPNGIEAVLVDPAHAAAAAAAAEDDLEPAHGLDPGVAPGVVDRWTPFVASNGKRVRVSCVLEPVVELKHFGRIGHRIVRRVLCVGTDEALTPAEIQNLSRADIERIDLATIARGMDRLRNEAGGDDALTVFIPVSYVSLSSRQGRAAIAALFEEARALVKAGVIAEVGDIEGVPQTALLDAATLMKPYCLFLVGRLNAAPAHGLDNLRNAGLQAVSFDAPPGPLGDGEFVSWARAALATVRPIAKSVMVHRLANPRRAAMVGLLGASHASVRPAVATEGPDVTVTLPG